MLPQKEENYIIAHKKILSQIDNVYLRIISLTLCILKL